MREWADRLPEEAEDVPDDRERDQRRQQRGQAAEEEALEVLGKRHLLSGLRVVKWRA